MNRTQYGNTTGSNEKNSALGNLISPKAMKVRHSNVPGQNSRLALQGLNLETEPSLSNAPLSGDNRDIVSQGGIEVTRAQLTESSFSFLPSIQGINRNFLKSGAASNTPNAASGQRRYATTNRQRLPMKNHLLMTN